MANRNKVPTKASAPLTGARKRKYDEERMMEERERMMEERRRNTPKLERRDPRNVPAMTRAQYRELMGGKGGTGDPDAMLGERMNPLIEAPMFAFGGLPATVKSTLGAVGLTVGTMAGLEKLTESNPRMANLVNLGLLALSAPGIAASARRVGIKQLNDLISEPTEQKLNLLGEMLKYHKKKHNLNGVDDKTIDLALKGAIWELDGRRPQAQKDVQYQWQVKKENSVQPGGLHVWTSSTDGEKNPIRGTRWYKDLVQRYGREQAEWIAETVSSPSYEEYFLPPGPKGEPALSEITKYATGKKLIKEITEPGEIIVAGSGGINLDGTISRETAVPHDLDFSGYIANASRRTDIPFYLKDGKPLSPQARDEMFAALSNHDNIENAPLIQKLRNLRPELRDAPFRYARYDWEFGGGAQYEPGVFTVVKKPDITKNGNGNVLVTTMLDGYKTDLMLVDAKLSVNATDPRYGTAATAFDWKDYYTWRAKDAADRANYVAFSQNNPVASDISGRARFSPSRFADSLVTDEGLPVVVDIEQYPGGPTIPMIMNHRGVMLSAADPYNLRMFSSGNPINSPIYQAPATSTDKPLVAIRRVPRGIPSDIPGEAAPSIAVHRGDTPEWLARMYLNNLRGGELLKVYKNADFIDPAADLRNFLYTKNASSGGPFSFWPFAGNNITPYETLTQLRAAGRESSDPALLESLAENFARYTRGMLEDAYLTPRIDNRVRNLVYGRGNDYYNYLEAKPGRYVPDSEATIINPGEPGAYDKLVNALKRSTFAVPIAGAGLSLGTQGSEDERETQQAAEGGDTEGPDGAPVETPMEVPAGAPVPEGGPRIVINPEVFEDKRDALCVAMNEAFRVLMEVNGFNPVSEPTDAQRQFFADTAYSQNENQMRRTILARICTFDTSVKDPTEEQLEESVEFLEAVMEMGAPQNEWEQQAVQRIHDVLVAAIEKGTSVGDTPTEEPPAPEDVQEGDPRGEQAAVGGGVSDKDLDKIGQGKGGHFQNQRGQTVAAWNNTARDSAGRVVRRDSAQQTNNAAGQAGGGNPAKPPEEPNEFVAQFLAGEAGGNPAKPPEEPNEFVAQFLAGEAGGDPAKPSEEPNEFVLYNQDSSVVENDTHSLGERETFLKERGMDTELAKTATMDQLIALHTKQVEDGVAPSGSADKEEEIG